MYGFIYFQIRGFYRGLSWPLCSFGIVNSVFFGVYGNTLKFLESDKSKRKSNYLNIYLSGCVGGAVQLLFVVPVDYIKTALQSQIPHQTATARGKLFGVLLGSAKKKVYEITNGVARTLKRLRTSNGDFCIKQCFSTITPLSKIGTYLKGKNLPPEGANCFL